MPIQVNLNSETEKVIDAQCGNSHTMVLTEAGRIYAWGQGLIDNACQFINTESQSKSVIHAK